MTGGAAAAADDDDGVARFPVAVIDALRPDGGDVDGMHKSKAAAAACALLAKFACCRPGAAAAAVAAAAASMAGRPPPGRTHHHHRPPTHQPPPRQGRSNNGPSTQSSSSSKCWTDSGAKDAHGSSSLTKRGRTKIGVGGAGSGSGERALLGALNKLNDRNFDAIRARVHELVGSGDVTASKAALSALAKSSDDATYAPVFARLVASICEPIARKDGEDAGAGAGAGAGEGEGDAKLAVAGFVMEPFEDGGAGLACEVERVGRAIDDPGATPTAGYDKFCDALKLKRRLLGRFCTALAVLSLMARDLPPGTIPRPAAVADACVFVLRRSMRRFAVAPMQDTQEDENEERGSAAAADVALDLLSHLVGVLRVASAGGNASQATAMRALLDGVREAAATADPDQLPPKLRFKIEGIEGIAERRPDRSEKTPTAGVSKAGAGAGAPPPSDSGGAWIRAGGGGGGKSSQQQQQGAGSHHRRNHPRR